MKFDVRVQIVPRSRLQEPALDSEAAVWRALAAGEDLVVVADDEKLVSWVRRIASAHGWEVEKVRDPVEEFRSRYPSLAAYAEELVGDAPRLEEPVLWNLLRRCASDLPVSYQASRSHAQEIVRWRIGNELKPGVLAALKLAVDGFAADELRPIYGLVLMDDPNVLVEHVVGLREPVIGSKGAEKESARIEEPVRAWVRRRLAESGFPGVRKVFLSSDGDETKVWVAEEVVKAASHPLQSGDARLIERFLSGDLRDLLHRKVQQPAPGAPPAAEVDGEDLSDWFERCYLPYRTWMHANGISADEAAEESWVAFAELARTTVKKGFGSGQGPLAALLSRRRRLESEAEGERNLLVVLDGPLPLDVDEFLKRLREKAEGWGVVSRRWALAALPTVTEVCRPAVVTGTDRLAGKEDTAVGTIDEAEKRLGGSRFVVLKVNEPDQSYHRFADHPETVRENATMALAKLANRLAKLLAQGGCNRLFVTADHGRCLGPSRPVLERPQGEVHGRAVLNVPKGTPVPDGAERLDGSAYQFSTDSDAIVALGDRCFRDAPGTWYLHGGLLPEEVMVPWVELACVPANIEVDLFGLLTGEQNGSGQLDIRVVNASPVDLECEWVGFASKSQLRTSSAAVVRVARASSVALTIPIEKIEGELPRVGMMRVRTPNGDTEERQVEIEDKVKKLMEKSLNLEDELGLD